MRYTSSVNCVLVLLLRDWYTATSGHWIILVSHQFSKFSSLAKGYLKASNHFSFSSLLCFREFGIISSHLNFSRFSSSTSLVRIRLYTNPQSRAVWFKASSQSSVKSCRSCASLLRSLGIKIFSGLHNFPEAPKILIVTPPPTRCTWTRFLSNMPATQFTRTSAEETPTLCSL